MNYIEIEFSIEPIIPVRDVLIAELNELPFESFVETATGLKAYIPEKDFEESFLDSLLAFEISGARITWKQQRIGDQNWNEEWEKNFEPITVDDQCIVRAPFHAVESKFPYEIIIDPKMSFGTGHHATTHLMISEMITMDLKGKKVLDMGSGTGVLAILAEKLGASSVLAIDIDEWAWKNAIENVRINGCSGIEVLLGDRKLITGKFSVILANINRNILVADMGIYLESLNSGGDILFSGFFEEDEKLILEAAGKSATLRSKKTRQGWSMMHFTKI